MIQRYGCVIFLWAIMQNKTFNININDVSYKVDSITKPTIQFVESTVYGISGAMGTVSLNHYWKPIDIRGAAEEVATAIMNNSAGQIVVTYPNEIWLLGTCWLSAASNKAAGKLKIVFQRAERYSGDECDI